MKQHVHRPVGERGQAPFTKAPLPRALALQRTVGNRALARWVKHPDEEKKGVMVPDSSAEAYLAGNPPQNA